MTKQSRPSKEPSTTRQNVAVQCGTSVGQLSMADSTLVNACMGPEEVGKGGQLHAIW